MMMPHTSICNKETRARIENLRPSELLVVKTALIMLKFTPITLQRKRREGGHQRKTWNVGAPLSKASVLQRRGYQRKKGNVDETLSKASVLQRRGHQRETWNAGAPLSKASGLQCRGHQRKKGNAGVFKPTSAITNSQSKVLGKSSYDI